MIIKEMMNNEYKIEAADTQEKYEGLRSLWCRVFGDEPEYVDALYGNFGREAEGYVVLDAAGKVCAALTCYIAGYISEQMIQDCAVLNSNVSGAAEICNSEADDELGSGEADAELENGEPDDEQEIGEADAELENGEPDDEQENGEADFDTDSDAVLMLPVYVSYAICTAPELRGRGLGGKLTAYVRDVVCSRGGVSLVSPAEPSLIAFYARLGYEPVCRVTDYCQEIDAEEQIRDHTHMEADRGQNTMPCSDGTTHKCRIYTYGESLDSNVIALDGEDPWSDALGPWTDALNPVTEIDALGPDEYNRYREVFLVNIPHIVLSSKMMQLVYTESQEAVQSGRKTEPTASVQMDYRQEPVNVHLDYRQESATVHSDKESNSDLCENEAYTINSGMLLINGGDAICIVGGLRKIDCSNAICDAGGMQLINDDNSNGSVNGSYYELTLTELIVNPALSELSSEINDEIAVNIARRLGAVRIIYSMPGHERCQSMISYRNTYRQNEDMLPDRYNYSAYHEYYRERTACSESGIYYGFPVD